MAATLLVPVRPLLDNPANWEIFLGDLEGGDPVRLQLQAGALWLTGQGMALESGAAEIIPATRVPCASQSWVPSPVET